MLFLRYEHEANRKVEGTIVKEVRGNFGKDKWEKAEIKGASILECMCLCICIVCMNVAKYCVVGNQQYLVFLCTTTFSIYMLWFQFIFSEKVLKLV